MERGLERLHVARVEGEHEGIERLEGGGLSFLVSGLDGARDGVDGERSPKSRDTLSCMPISAQWDAQAQLWKLKVGNSFDLAEISDLIERTEWNAAKSFLWDLRDLKQGPDSSDELRQAVDLTAKTQEFWVGSRVAILVTRDLDFGIARMFAALAEEIDVVYRAFRDEPSALAWLGTSSTE